MILPFTTVLKGKETLFPEKILSCMIKELENKDNNVFINAPNFLYDYGEFAGYMYVDECLYEVDNAKPKLHTIREDKKDRWKPGTMIDFFINARQKNMFRFAPRVPVVSEQKIEIIYDKIFGKSLFPSIFIDRIKLHPERLEELSINDGFDTLEEFLQYFSEDYKGKLIHWTDFRY